MPKATVERPHRKNYRFSDQDVENLEAAKKIFDTDEETTAISKALEEVAKKEKL